MCIIGKSGDSLKRNIISELARLLGAEMQYFSGNRELHLWGRVVHVIGANDDRAEGKIRGCTFAGALVDEGTTIPENFFKMLLSRLSVEGAKMFLTTNPDSPFHWLKTDYMDRHEELDLKRFKFVLDDNPSLTADYKNNLKMEYRGLWYRRFIDGDWVLAEGTIYDFFDEDIHCIPFPQSRGKYYVVGVDYGTVNPCAFGLFGYNPDKYPNMWKEKEYYWSSKKKLRQKTDEEYAQDLVQFCDGYNVKAVLIDPSAASFIAECRKQGIMNIMEANNDVLDGIRFYAQLLTTGALKICKQCKVTLQEMQTYVWDEKAALLGEEKPKKTNDHCMDADRYAAMFWFEQGLNATTPEELDMRYHEAMGMQMQMNLPAFFRDPY